MSELIDRQAAIDALEQIFDQCEEIEAHLPEGDPDRTGYKMYPDYMTVWKYLHQLPSAQPEPLTLRVNNELTKEEYGKLMQDIKDAPIVLLPSAQPEQRWIPCSERLPEDYEDVLVWFEYFRYGDYNRLYQTHGIGDYSSEYDSWMINHESGWSKLRVFAWMPLPEPYKGEQE